MGNEALFELRRRTFDTPHFRGIEFIEAEAKSIINHVPGNYLPFNCSKRRNAPGLTQLPWLFELAWLIEWQPGILDQS